MKYPEEFGVFPSFHGWRLVNWMEEIMEVGDRMLNLGSGIGGYGHTPSEFGAELGENYAGKIPESIWGRKIAKHYPIYRRVSEWVEIGMDEKLRAKDLLANKNFNPNNTKPDLAKRTYGPHGYQVLSAMSEEYTGDILVKNYSLYSWVEKVFRRTGDSEQPKKSRRLPQNAHYSKPLPLP